MKRKGLCLFGIMVILSGILAGCGQPAQTEPQVAEIIEIFPEEENETTPVVQVEEQATEADQAVPEISEKVSDTLMEVHFIDVGQGDATLIRNGEHAMMIDAGDNEHGIALQLYLQKQGVKKLDYFILTHPDSDHIGGADVLICKLDIDQVYETNFVKTNSTAEDVENALVYRNLTAKVPKVGEQITLGDATITFLAPVGTYDNANDSSIAIRIDKGEKSFLFSGDCEEEAEMDMIHQGLDLDVDVYQAGHHGSRYASSEAFLDAMTPEITVISCMFANEYGYPHSKLLNRLRSSGTQVYRTDEQGSIVATCDGVDITFNCAPSDTWQTGEDRRNSVVIEPETLPESPVCFVVNKNSGVVHKSNCEKLPSLTNQVIFETFADVQEVGYDKYCGNCRPEK